MTANRLSRCKNRLLGREVTVRYRAANYPGQFPLLSTSSSNRAVTLKAIKGWKRAWELGLREDRNRQWRDLDEELE